MRIWPKRKVKPIATEDASKSREKVTSFAWEFGAGGWDESSAVSMPASEWSARARRTADDGDELGRKPASGSVQYVRSLLAIALERWWEYGHLPPKSVLREGLHLLEQNVILSDDERTLLLRSALFYRRGVVTAVRHMLDGERTAILVREEIVTAAEPLPDTLLFELFDLEESVEWLPELYRELQLEVAAGGVEIRERAQHILSLIEGILHQWPIKVRAIPDELQTPSELSSDRHPWLIRVVIVLTFFVLLTGYFGSRIFLQDQHDMVQMPSGAYVVINGQGNPSEPLWLEAMRIDRYEVTNVQYRRCVERGGCTMPQELSSFTHADYFSNPAFDQYPVVNISWYQGGDYCRWQGKRLPSEAEWQVMAGTAFATQRQFEYPWGDYFDPLRANTAVLGVGDTRMVGSFRPAGDSPLGVADMAGNVAEWTRSWHEGESGQVVVKGGSYFDQGSMVAVSTRQTMAPDFYASWLGFRCAQ
jgi:hypothetical protein